MGSRTRWVRFWADWPSLMPFANRLDPTRMAALDAQIARARADGLRSILTPYRFPTWANGTDAMTSDQLGAEAAGPEETDIPSPAAGDDRNLQDNRPGAHLR